MNNTNPFRPINPRHPDEYLVAVIADGNPCKVVYNSNLTDKENAELFFPDADRVEVYWEEMDTYHDPNELLNEVMRFLCFKTDSLYKSPPFMKQYPNVSNHRRELFDKLHAIDRSDMIERTSPPNPYE